MRKNVIAPSSRAGGTDEGGKGNFRPRKEGISLLVAARGATSWSIGDATITDPAIYKLINGPLLVHGSEVSSITNQDPPAPRPLTNDGVRSSPALLCGTRD